MKFCDVIVDLRHVQTVKHPLMSDIQSLTELQSGKIAVACGTGLHLLTEMSACRHGVNVVMHVQ